MFFYIVVVYANNWGQSLCSVTALLHSVIFLIEVMWHVATSVSRGYKALVLNVLMLCVVVASTGGPGDRTPSAVGKKAAAPKKRKCSFPSSITFFVQLVLCLIYVWCAVATLLLFGWLFSSVTCFRREFLMINGTGFYIRNYMSLLLPNQQRQNTEGSSNHWPQSGKIIH